MGINLRLASSPNGTKNLGPINMGGGPNLIKRSLFSENTPNLPYASWYVPGSGSPAISTADYYHINGLYWSRPYDLDTMGAEGAAIKARENGMRYVWMLASDHPSNINFRDGGHFYVGYSSDPQVWPEPTTVRVLRTQNDSINVVDQNGYTQNTYLVYMVPHLVYNPDSAGDKFYIYAEAQSTSSSRQHELGLFTTADFLTTTLLGPAIPTTNFNGWTSFGRPRRLGVNNWEVVARGKADASAVNNVFYKYTSTDGFAWTPDFSKILAGAGPYLTISGQGYMIVSETTASNDYLSLLAVDSDKVSLGTYTRISAAFGKSVGDDTAYPGPTWLSGDLEAYEEDGVASIYATRGFFSGVTNSLMQGPYLGNFPTFYDLVGEITGNTTLNVTSLPGGALPLAIGHRLLFLANSPIYITGFGTGSGGLGTYTVTSTNNLAAGTTIKIATNGGLLQQFIDQYFLVTDSSAAAGAAPLGVEADCNNGTITVRLNDILPNGNYRVYRGANAASQATLVGDFTGSSYSFALASNAQCYIKVVKLNGGVEQKSRVVSVYSSSYPLMVNRHVNRVANDGGDTTKIDFTFLASVVSYLTTNNYWRYLLFWVDARFGVKESGGFITKVYCLGTTQLPRGGDYTPTTSNTFPSTTSNTSYSANSFRGTTPSWINNANSARGYFGNGRANNIQRKNQITLIAAYQKPNSTGTASLFGMGQFNSGLYLQHPNGTSGNVTFAMSHSNTLIPSTAPFASATSAHVAAGIFDGTNITTVLDGVAGTPVDASVANNPNLTKDTTLRGEYDGTLTGSSNHSVLMSGTRTGLMVPSAKTYNNSDSHGQFTCACLAAFEIGSAQIVSDITTMYA